MKKKYSIFCAFVCMILFVMVVGAAGQNENIEALLNREISVRYNGTEVNMLDENGESVYPISYEGTTYLPIRAISEMLDIEIEWNPEANSVLVQNGKNTTVTFTGETMPGGSIDSFSVELLLPENWYIQRVDDESQTQEQQLYLCIGGHDKQFVYSDDGVCVGAIAYNAYSLDAGVEENRKSVYSEIAIGSRYSFDVYNTYEIIGKTEHGETAITKVCYSAEFLSPWYENAEETKNDGILSYDNQLGAYVMIELDSALVSDKEVQSIAKTLTVK